MNVQRLFPSPASFVLVAIASLVAITGRAADRPANSVADAAHEKPEVMPEFTVRDILRQYPPIPAKQLKQADFKDVAPYLHFPASAANQGIFDGRATIGLMLDENGRVVDVIPISYSAKAFVDAIVAGVREEQFTPRRISGVAVPSPLLVSNRFTGGYNRLGPPGSDPYRTGMTPVSAMTPMEAIQAQANRIMNPDGSRLIYEPHSEFAIDGGELRLTAATVPQVPAGYTPPRGKMPKVLVTFYVDEKGNVRLPNVDSTPSPLLVVPTLDAIAKWTFVPPTIKGKPVLVIALRGITFNPASP